MSKLKVGVVAVLLASSLCRPVWAGAAQAAPGMAAPVYLPWEWLVGIWQSLLGPRGEAGLGAPLHGSAPDPRLRPAAWADEEDDGRSNGCCPPIQGPPPIPPGTPPLAT